MQGLQGKGPGTENEQEGGGSPAISAVSYTSSSMRPNNAVHSALIRTPAQIIGVPRYHTYYVAQIGILVHNGCSANGGKGGGRGGRQARLRELADDPKVSSADRGWLCQEMNQIARGKRSSIRNPPGTELAHPRGREAAKGFSHIEAPSRLQDIDLHRLQHKYDNFGQKNPPGK